MAKYFYYNEKGEKKGAFSGKEIKALAKGGLINPQTVIETEEGKKYYAHGIGGVEFVNADAGQNVSVVPGPIPASKPPNSSASTPQKNYDPIDIQKIEKLSRIGQQQNTKPLNKTVQYMAGGGCVGLCISILIAITIVFNTNEWTDFHTGAIIAAVVIALVSVALFANIESILWAQKETEYRNALSELQKNPSNPELRNKVLALGRNLIEDERKKKIGNKDHIPKYTEQSLSNDLMVCLSGNTSAPVNTAEEIQKLNDLYSSGIITQEEFERGKALFLGTPKDRSQQILESLSNLHQMKRQGAVSESEYNMAKWELLSGKLVK